MSVPGPLRLVRVAARPINRADSPQAFRASAGKSCGRSVKMPVTPQEASSRACSTSFTVHTFDVEAGVAHRAHVGGRQPLDTRVNGGRTKGGCTLAPLVGGALDQPAESDARAGLVEGGEQVVVERRNDEAGRNLLVGERDSQGIDEALTQAIPTRAGLDLQVRAHLLRVGESQDVRGLGDALETVGVREPAAGVEAADVGEPKLVVRAGPRRRAVEGVVVDDDEGAVTRDVHVELEPAGADLHGLRERGDRVFRRERGRTPVGHDTGEFGHGSS